MFTSIKNYFHTIFSLVALQIKNKSSLSFKNNKVGFIVRFLIYILLFAGLTVGCYFLFSVFQNDSIFGILVVPLYFFNFVFISIFLLIIITSLFKFKNELYFAKDNQILLMLPASKNQLFLSKIIVCYLLEFLRNFLFTCPLFIAYGALNNFVAGFYPWLIFTLIFILMLPVAIASLLSLVIFKIQLWLKKHYVIKNLSIVFILLAVVAGLILLCTFIPKELRIDERWQTVILPQLKNFVLGYEKAFYPITCLSMLILGYTNSLKSPYRLPIFTDKTFIIFLCIILFIAICIAINLLILKRYFISNISRGSEHTKTYKNPIFKYDFKKFSVEAIFAYKKNKKLSIEEYRELINELYEKERELFSKCNYSLDEYLKILKKHFTNITFIKRDLTSLKDICLILKKEKHSTRILLLEDSYLTKLTCYDPYRFEKKNKKLPGILAMSKKNVISDIRNSYDLFINAIIIFVPACCLIAVNTIFSSLRLTIFGNQLVFTFTLLAILLFFTFYAGTASCIYSKNQKNSYVLNVSPYSKFINVFMSLFHLFIIGFVSIILIVIAYSYTTPINEINPGFLLVALTSIFLLLLIVNASIDLFSLKRHNFTSVTSEKAGDQNELYAFLISSIIVALFSALGFLFFYSNKDKACLYLMLVSLLALFIYSLFLLIYYIYRKRKKRKLAL